MPTLTSNPLPAAPVKARKPRKKSPYVLQSYDAVIGDGEVSPRKAPGWQDFKATDNPSFPDAAAAKKFVRDGQYVGKFRVIRVVSEFTSAIEERKVVKLT